MRKWMRVGVALLLLLALFLLPRSEIEIHKRECQTAWNRLRGRSIAERLKGIYYRITKTKPSADRWGDNYRALTSSRQALVELDYLMRERIGLSNAPVSRVVDEFRKSGLENAFVWIEWGGNAVIVSAPPSEFVVVSNAIRKIDATLK